MREKIIIKHGEGKPSTKDLPLATATPPIMDAIFATIASKDIDRTAARGSWITANVLGSIATLENFSAVHKKTPRLRP